MQPFFIERLVNEGKAWEGPARVTELVRQNDFTDRLFLVNSFPP